MYAHHRPVLLQRGNPFCLRLIIAQRMNAIKVILVHIAGNVVTVEDRAIEAIDLRIALQ